MNRFLNKVERKFGRYAIRDLMKYVVVIYLAGAVIGMFAPSFYYDYLALDIGKVLHGQVWRLVTFLLAPYGMTSMIDIIFLAIETYLYLFIGRSLENVWGAFRFNLYYVSGILFNIIAAFILYFVFGAAGGSYPMGLTYINRSLFLAFTVIFPNMQLLLFFIIPIKVKWLGIIYGILIGVEVFSYFRMLTPMGISVGVAILVALANFLIYYLSTRNYKRVSPKEVKRKAEYKKQVNKVVNFPRHRCEVCGRTEKDNPELEFRFCSKCDGDHEYCMDHLYTHEHIKKEE
ncbi:hypothetical protein [Anaerolentibacter hominis]|uniref:hypothetical protein n=1 Tax=Anaerolentibacter hominis TaxID=3079009 RepID=UPI0031B81DEB